MSFRKMIMDGIHFTLYLTILYPAYAGSGCPHCFSVLSSESFTMFLGIMNDAFYICG